MGKYFRRFSDLQNVYCLVEGAVPDGAYKCTGDAMTCAVGQCKDYQITLPAEEIKITAYNILWFEKDKALGETLPYVQIIRKECFLYMPGIVIAALNLPDGHFDLFMNCLYLVTYLGRSRSKGFDLIAQLICFTKELVDSALRLDGIL